MEAALGLAVQRLEATRTELIKSGVAANRVQRADGKPSVGRAANGSVKFELRSAS